MKKTTKYCTCGRNKTSTCRNCSKVRMAMMLKNGNRHLKVLDENNKRCNPVRYSYLKHNNTPLFGNSTAVIPAMMRRFKTSKYASVTNVVIFYDNYTNTEIDRYRI